MEEAFMVWFTLLAQIFAMMAMHWILAPPKTWTDDELQAELEEWTDESESEEETSQ